MPLSKADRDALRVDALRVLRAVDTATSVADFNAIVVKLAAAETHRGWGPPTDPDGSHPSDPIADLGNDADTGNHADDIAADLGFEVGKL